MKSQQRGFAVWAILGTIVAVGAMIVWWAISASNYAARTEVTLNATWTNNQNILGNYTLKVQEAASVPSMYADDLKKVMTEVMSARMGKDGSKAVMQWFKEANIPFDSSLYAKIQLIVESGRNEFQTAQTRLIDQRQSYETALSQFPGGTLMRFMGYPKVDLKKFDPVVAGDTRKAFETGVQAPVLQMRK